MGSSLYTQEIFLKVSERNKNFFQVFQKPNLLAYSGGKDSTLLLHYYLFLNQKFGFPKPILFHLQHCIRENEEQEKKIYSYMQSLNLEFYFHKKNIPKIAKKLGKTLEETGRFVRYALLKKISRKKGCFIVTAHHSLDYLESVLIHLIRGGGKSSFSTLPILNGNIFRPLLLFKYSEIQEILQNENWIIFEDETNQNELYLRNRIRKKLVFQLLNEGLNLEKLYKNFHDEVIIENFNFSCKRDLSYSKICLPISISISQLKAILDAYLKCLELHPITSKILSEIYRQIQKNSIVQIENKEAIFWKSISSEFYIIPKKSKVLEKPKILENKIYWNYKTYEVQNETLCNSRIGRKILMKYGSKEISEILRENQIPTPVRNYIPILEKNGLISKILLSMWDEKLKDIVAHEKRT